MMDWLFGKSYWFEYTLNENIVGQAIVIIAFVMFCIWIVKKVTRDTRVYNDTGFNRERLEIQNKRDAAYGTPEYPEVLKETKKEIAVLQKKHTKRIMILSKIEHQLNKLVDAEERKDLVLCIARELGMAIEVIEIRHRQEPEKPWYVMRAKKIKVAIEDVKATVVETVEP